MKLYDIPQIGAKMYLRDETDLWGFLQNGKYEPEETELVKKLVKKDMICLDIGANIGYYSILMTKQCEWVVAFEPEKSNCDLLKQNIKINRLGNINCYEIAVTHGQGGDILYLCPTSHGMHRVFKSKFCDKFKTVDSVSIDFMKYSKIDFIKMDIEG